MSAGAQVIDHESPFTSQLQLLLLSLRSVRISFALGFTPAGSRWGIRSYVLPQRVCTQLPDHGLVDGTYQFLAETLAEMAQQ